MRYPTCGGTALREQIWNDAAQAIVRAGRLPMPVTAGLKELIRTILTEDQARFVPVFNGSLTFEQIREKSGMEGARLTAMLDGLMDNGVITGTACKCSGVMVYRLIGPFPGIFEFTMMRRRAIAMLHTGPLKVFVPPARA